MVTIEGELLVPGGAISGGRFKNNSNLLGRRREMEELDKERESGEDNYEGLGQQTDGGEDDGTDD